MEQPVKSKRGRKAGTVYGPTEGSLAYWLLNAEPGAVAWSEQSQGTIHTTAVRNGVRVAVRGYIAVAPNGAGVSAVKLNRIEVES